MFKYRFVKTNAINSALNKKLPTDISVVIASKLEQYISQFNESVDVTIYLSSTKVEFDRLNNLFQAKKYFVGKKNAIVETNCNIDDNTVITFLIDNVNSTVEINILLK